MNTKRLLKLANLLKAEMRLEGIDYTVKECIKMVIEIETLEALQSLDK